MNYEYLKNKMDKFFSETDPSETVKRFEKMGYSFTDCPVIHWDVIAPISIDNLFICHQLVHKKHWYEIPIFSKKDKKLNKKLTSEYPGPFFLLRIAT
jgi:hypothetical protein